MKHKIYLLLALLLFSNALRSQDTLILHFKNKKIFIRDSEVKVKILSNDSLYSEYLFKLTGSKFIYVKQASGDSLPTEAGQLGLYKIDGESYLLREGFWFFEDNEKKILYRNSGTTGIVGEMRSSANQNLYDRSKNKNKKKKKAVHLPEQN